MDTSSKSKDGVNDAIKKYKDYPSIKMTNEKVSFESNFNFKDNMQAWYTKKSF